MSNFISLCNLLVSMIGTVAIPIKEKLAANHAVM